MQPKNKFLFLCDAHDFVRHEGTNKLLLKQLYVTIFLLRKHFEGEECIIHVANRSIVDFEVFWSSESPQKYFLKDICINRTWNQINVSEYDIIICHPDYQNEVKEFAFKDSKIENNELVYTLNEIEYTIENTFRTAGSMFVSNGLFRFEGNDKSQKELIEFKKLFDQSVKRLTIDEQELHIPGISKIISFNNRRLIIEKFRKILIMDGYKRAFYIGDSVYWLSKIRKLIDVFPDSCEFQLNIDNKVAFNAVVDGFQQSLTPKIQITNQTWSNINFEDYDLIICNNDSLLKFYWFLKSKIDNPFTEYLIYSFTAMDERQIGEILTMDIYLNLHFSGYKKQLDQTNFKEKEIGFTEIPVTEKELSWAGNWLLKRGLDKADKLIVLFHGASTSEKVMREVELLKLIKLFNYLDESNKVLLVMEKRIADNLWLNNALKNREFKGVLIADSLRIREVICLLGSSQVHMIVGPCTGFMHIADGIYSTFVNKQLISKSECPLLLTYTGKQGTEVNYHPYSWWKYAKIVECCVAVNEIDGNGRQKLIPLSECPRDIKLFYEKSIKACEIKSETIFNYILKMFPPLLSKGKNTKQNATSILSNYGLNTEKLNMEVIRIPTFIINLKKRFERKTHIIKQFEDKPEFNYKIVEAIEEKNPRLGLWKTIKQIISNAFNCEEDFVLIVEDDHQFSENYSSETLFSCINDAKILGADILLGGVSYCDKNIKFVQSNLVSLDRFAATQFTIFFRHFFSDILNVEFSKSDCADLKLAAMSDKKLVIYPFISTQKDFGYSDVTDGYFENKMSYTASVAEHSISQIV